MGSQSVTDFSAVRMKRIRELVRDYSPKSRSAEAQAREIGAAAVGTLRPSPEEARGPAAKRKGRGQVGVAGGGGASAVTMPTNEFGQALSSRSVETALGLILTLAKQLETDPQTVYQESGVGDEKQPLGGIGAFLRKAHAGILTKTQAETESAFAANDAIPKTIIDVVARAFPREKEPVNVDRSKFAEAFRRVPQKEIVTTFFENVASALINLVLDATRGKLPPAQVNEIKQSVRQHFIPEFIERLKKGEFVEQVKRGE